MIAGRISEQNSNTMLEKTQTRQLGSSNKVSEGRKRLSNANQLANDAKQWVEAIQEIPAITQWNAATNRLIKEIVVHERIDEDKTRHISSEFILFNLKPIPAGGTGHCLPAAGTVLLTTTPYRFFVRRRPPIPAKVLTPNWASNS